MTCIGINPGRAASDYHIRSAPLASIPALSWKPRHRTGKLIRKVCTIGGGLIREPYFLVKGLLALRRTEVLIMPGGGLLTDGYGLFRGGPYDVLTWTLIAKACRCKVVFLSVGAGPLHGRLARRMVKLALSLADIRSYRDPTTKRYLERIGAPTNGDRVYPDLVFSLPRDAVEKPNSHRDRPVVGIGPMESMGTRGGRGTSEESYAGYLESLVSLAEWLIRNGYDVRALVGDYVNDQVAKNQFGELLRRRLPGAEEHLIDDPIYSVDQLLAQLADTDLVVASRFHNVVLAFLCGKPVVAISFDNKLDALMGAMAMSEYCLDGNSLDAAQLIDAFRGLEGTGAALEPEIRERVSSFRSALEDQYERLFDTIGVPARSESSLVTPEVAAIDTVDDPQSLQLSVQRAK